MTEELNSEVWVPCTGHLNYLVSNMGRVRRISSGRILKPFLGKGYLRVHLSRDNVSTMPTIHRLVAKEFCEGTWEGRQVNHIDGNKLNNNANNLEWVTQLENVEHAVRLGIHKTISLRKFTDSQVLEMLNLSKTMSSRSVCKKFGASNSFLNRVRKGRVYKHLMGEVFDV